MQNNNQRKFKKFKKVPLVMASGFLVLSGVGFWFIHQTIESNEKASQSANSEGQNEAGRREAIRSLERSIKEVQVESAELETHFASSTNAVPFLDTLEKMAFLAGGEAEVSSVDIQKDNPILTVGIIMKGSFESSYKFLKLLENSPYEIEIISMDISRLPKGEGDVSSEWESRYKINLLSFIK